MYKNEWIATERLNTAARKVQLDREAFWETGSESRPQR